MVSAAYDWQHWPDTFRDVRRALPSGRAEDFAGPLGCPRTTRTSLTRDQAEELLKGGTERARQHCAAELAKGNYWPGCPIQSKYY